MDQTTINYHELLTLSSWLMTSQLMDVNGDST